CLFCGRLFHRLPCYGLPGLLFCLSFRRFLGRWGFPGLFTGLFLSRSFSSLFFSGFSLIVGSIAWTEVVCLFRFLPIFISLPLPVIDGIFLGCFRIVLFRLCRL